MWFDSLQYNIAKALNFPNNPRNDPRIVAMREEMGRRGGLNFKMYKHKDGWMAECVTIKGIIAGNDNPNPSQQEVDTYIKGAIFSAFNIPSYLCDDTLIRTNLSAAVGEKELVYV